MVGCKPRRGNFSYETMRMEMVNFGEVLFNPVAQVKFVHTVAAGYVTGSMFVLGISAWYLLKNAIWVCENVRLQLPLALAWRPFYRLFY